jgi:hypothetical protein
MTLVPNRRAILMLRQKPAVLLAAAFGALVCASPVAAQFGSIFGDGPPRPPANVPTSPPADDDRYYQTRPQIWPREPQVVAPPQPYPQQQAYPPQQGYPPPPPPGYPQQALPRPDGLPPPPGAPQQAVRPQVSPPPGGIQQQTLAPPPGATVAPPDQQPATPATLPGLPPGQRQPRGTPQQTDTSLQPGDEVVVPPPAQKIPNNTAVFSGLDKITGRIISFDVAINETVQFGALQVTPRVCYTRPPTETPNTDAFIEVDEITLQSEIKRIFTGWMFAASPGLHAVEHPIYDVWLVDCKGPQTPAVASATDAPPLQQQPAPQRPPQRAARPRQPAPVQPR